MTTILKIVTVLVLTIIIILGMANCSPSVSVEDYDNLKSELQNAENQMATLQEELNKAALIEEQYRSLNINYEELQKQYDAINDEIQKLKTEYDELNTQYEQLMEQADVPDTVLNEKELEQAIFALINRERTDNDMKELEWGKHLYDKCKFNSREMAEKGQFQYPEETGTTGEVFMATKYNTIDQLADATLTIWTNNEYRYKYQIINKQHPYGAVGAERAGDTYFITYLVSIYR